MTQPSQPLTPRQERFLLRLKGAQARLLAAIDGLDETVLCSETVVEGWTVKDMLGHIVSWNDEFRREIREILAGQHPGYAHQISGEKDFSEWNRVWIEQKRDRPWQHILQDIERDYQEESDLILSLHPQDYRQRGVTPWKRAAVDKPETPSRQDTDSVETLVTFHWRHINQHARMIEKWRKNRERTRETG